MTTTREGYCAALIRAVAHVDSVPRIRVAQGCAPRPGAKLVACFRHVASGYELAIALRGHPWIELPGGLVELHRGDVAFVEKGVEHAEIEADPAKAHRVLWCHSLRNHVTLRCSEYDPQAGWQEKQQLALDGRTDVESVAAAISAELQAREVGWEACAQGLLRYLMWILVRRLQRSPGSGPLPPEPLGLRPDSRSWDVVRGVLVRCTMAPDGRPDLRGIAADMGYHPTYLSRLVSSHLGQSLSQYVRGRWTEHARRLLERPDLSVREVAGVLGYDNPAHFSRAFSRAVGLSPSEYRRHRPGL